MAPLPPNISQQNFFSARQNSIFCIHQGRPISIAELISHAWQISCKLPDKTHGINLCQNRYYFTVAFLALLFRRQINLLPPNRAENTIATLLDCYEDSYCLIDNDNSPKPSNFAIDSIIVDTSLPESVAEFDGDQLVSISFTSGTTGQSMAVAKTWREFQQCAQLATHQLAIDQSVYTLVSTVPAQHMYGLETSLFWPLFSELCIHSRQPFFPEDISRITASADSPCILITTPTHLKACANAGISWQNINMILSSTAPMSKKLATQIETRLNAPLWEIFGSTETLSFASRQTTQSEQWQPYATIKLSSSKQAITVKGGHLQLPINLDDHFDISKSGEFTVLGRSSDLIKVAGKRASLAELNTIIKDIDGIEDAIFYATESGRLGALVVSKLTKKQINRELKLYLDAVFLPRPLHLVACLPRNEVRKIIKSSLQQLINDLDRV